MTEDDFEQRIAAKEGSLKTAIEQLESIRKEFVPLAAKFAADWWASTAKSEVERDAVTEKLTDEQLSKLKGDVQDLCTVAQRHVEEFFADSKAWWHLQSPLVGSPVAPSYFYFLDGSRGPDQIIKPLRFVLGKIAPILEKYGYLARDSRLSKGRGSGWREYDSTGNHHLPNGRPYYPSQLEWPKQFTSLIERYSAQMRDANDLLTGIESVRREQKQTAAKKRWDSV